MEGARRIAANFIGRACALARNTVVDSKQCATRDFDLPNDGLDNRQNTAHQKVLPVLLHFLCWKCVHAKSG